MVVLRDTVHAVSKASLRRLAKQAGVTRMSCLCYCPTRNQLLSKLIPFVHSAFDVNQKVINNIPGLTVNDKYNDREYQLGKTAFCRVVKEVCKHLGDQDKSWSKDVIEFLQHEVEIALINDINKAWINATEREKRKTLLIRDFANITSNFCWTLSESDQKIFNAMRV
jgi:histone H3/H4